MVKTMRDTSCILTGIGTRDKRGKQRRHPIALHTADLSRLDDDAGLLRRGMHLASRAHACYNRTIMANRKFHLIPARHLFADAPREPRAIEFLSGGRTLAEIARGRTAIAVARVRTSVSAGYKGRKKRVAHDTAAVGLRGDARTRELRKIEALTTSRQTFCRSSRALRKSACSSPPTAGSDFSQIAPSAVITRRSVFIVSEADARE